MITVWHILVYVIHNGENLNLAHANNKGTSPVLKTHMDNIIAIIYECGV